MAVDFFPQVRQVTFGPDDETQSIDCPLLEKVPTTFRCVAHHLPTRRFSLHLRQNHAIGRAWCIPACANHPATPRAHFLECANFPTGPRAHFLAFWNVMRLSLCGDFGIPKCPRRRPRALPGMRKSRHGRGHVPSWRAKITPRDAAGRFWDAKTRKRDAVG
jgi:hypothetical protein